MSYELDVKQADLWGITRNTESETSFLEGALAEFL
jgi:hypothetical protein